MRRTTNFFLAALMLCMGAQQVQAQHHDESEKYVAPTDPLVQQKLDD